MYLQAITDTKLLSDAFFEFDHFFVHSVTNLILLINTQEQSLSYSKHDSHSRGKWFRSQNCA